MIVRYSALLGPCFSVEVTAELTQLDDDNNGNHYQQLDLIQVIGTDWEDIEPGDDLLPFLNEKAITELQSYWFDRINRKES